VLPLSFWIYSKQNEDVPICGHGHFSEFRIPTSGALPYHAKTHENNSVGLSMMCYRLGKARRTCFGERQLRGRIGKLLY